MNATIILKRLNMRRDRILPKSNSWPVGNNNMIGKFGNFVMTYVDWFNIKFFKNMVHYLRLNKIPNSGDPERKINWRFHNENFFTIHAADLVGWKKIIVQ